MIPLRQLLLAFLPALLAVPTRAQAFDFEATAREYLEGLGVEDVTFDEFVEGPHFLSLPIGSFDLRVPCSALREKEPAAELREVVDIALRLQAAWASWRVADPDRRAALEEDVEDLRKWVKRWSPRDVTKAAEEGGPLLERLEADEDVVAAAQRLRDALVPRTVGQEGESEPRPARVVIAPDRRTFVQLVAAVGALETESRRRVWVDQHLFTPNAWALRAQLVPLRHPAYPYDPATAFEGWEVERYLTSSFEQHVAQRLASSLLKNQFHWATDPLLETALGTNLEIACLGEVKLVNDFSSFNWRRAGGSTQPYERFVPGGNSAGGILPPRKARAGPLQANSTTAVYVKEIGHGFFLEDLRERQKDGAKLASRDKELEVPVRKRKELHFALNADKEQFRVQAPFLGEAAATKTFPPLSFLDDYEDFFTAYRSTFLEWLRTEEGDDAEQHFAALLARMSEARDDNSLAAACREIYGMPLGVDPETEETLEGRFLTWLSKRR